jgi:hypothetical protein
VRLTDLIFNTQSVVRNITTFVRYPGDILFRQARRFAERQIENIEIPLSREDAKKKLATPVGSGARTTTIGKAAVPKAKKISAHKTKRQPIENPLEKSPFQEDDYLTGKRGRYRIRKLQDSFIAQQERGSRQEARISYVKHLYSARINKTNNVWIEEYRFSANESQMRKLKERVDRLEGVNLRSGGVQDFRIITPYDFFVDATYYNAGYLVSQEEPKNRISLREYLEKYEGMSRAELELLLNQVLQSLSFLHQQSIRFGDGTTQQGLIHGNLSLDTVWIEGASYTIGDRPQFKIYLKELSLWQDVFEIAKADHRFSDYAAASALSESASDQRQQDFRALSQIAASLLIDEPELDHCFVSRNVEKDLNQLEKWSLHSDTPLKKFIIALASSQFRTARLAISALRNLEPEEPEAIVAIADNNITAIASKNSWQYTLCFWLALLGVFGLAAWILRRNLPPQLINLSQTALQTGLAPTAINNKEIQDSLKALDKEVYTYRASVLWQDIIGRSRVSSNQNLPAELARTERDHSRNLQKFRLIQDNRTNWQEQLRQGEIAFMLQEWDPNLSSEFEQKLVAYDGIAVFVGATDPNKLNENSDRVTNLPKKLEGHITVNELTKAFARNNPFNNIPGRDIQFQAMLPRESQVQRTFQTLMAHQGIPIDLVSAEQLTTNSLLDRAFQNAQSYSDKEQVVIGFERISKVLGQCSVYPLKVKDDSGKAIQPLIQDTDKEVTPEIDLCHGKGSYWANEAAFQDRKNERLTNRDKPDYPFSYGLAIVYLKGNQQFQPNIQAAQAFYQVLTTDEGQCLLSEAGLVSIREVRKRKICQGGG